MAGGAAAGGGGRPTGMVRKSLPEMCIKDMYYSPLKIFSGRQDGEKVLPEATKSMKIQRAGGGGQKHQDSDETCGVAPGVIDGNGQDPYETCRALTPLTTPDISGRT